VGLALATTDLLSGLSRIRTRADWVGCDAHAPKWNEDCARCAKVAATCSHKPATRVELIAAIRDLEKNQQAR
jgi:hypothetical protein